MMKLTRDHFFARRSFNYGGEELDRGQVVELRGLVNDQKLINVGYFRVCHPGGEASECSTCGAHFINDHFREQHGELRHGFECVCGAHFGSQAALNGHLASCEVYRKRRKGLAPG